jgi:hypothetical protein
MDNIQIKLFSQFPFKRHHFVITIRSVSQSWLITRVVIRIKGQVPHMEQELLTLLLPFICSNIPAAPAYRVFISQLIRYSRACGSYQDFLDRGLLLLVKLKSSFRTLYGRHHDLVDRYGIYVSQVTTDMFHLS